MSYQECIPEINLALFEEICTAPAIIGAIKKNRYYKNFERYYVDRSKINTVLEAEREQKIEYRKELLRFIWENIVRKQLVKRVSGKDEIIENFSGYIKVSVSKILQFELWEQTTEIRTPESGPQPFKLIRKKGDIENKKAKILGFKSRFDLSKASKEDILSRIDSLTPEELSELHKIDIYLNLSLVIFLSPSSSAIPPHTRSGNSVILRNSFCTTLHRT